jgi:hypothetical protein
MDFWEKPLIGIYKITRRVTGKAYIGQSIDIFRRWKEHICFGEDKKNWQVIKHALYKYGITEFTFEILEECSKEDLNNREIYWISYFNTFTKDRKNGYNLNRGGEEICDNSKPCIITIMGISKEYESVNAVAAAFKMTTHAVTKYMAGKRHWPYPLSGNFKGEPPNICTAGTPGGHSKKSKPFYLKGILYSSQKEAIEKSEFPRSQKMLSDYLNGKGEWPDGWYGNFEGEEPKKYIKPIKPKKNKK